MFNTNVMEFLELYIFDLTNKTVLENGPLYETILQGLPPEIYGFVKISFIKAYQNVNLH